MHRSQQSVRSNKENVPLSKQPSSKAPNLRNKDDQPLQTHTGKPLNPLQQASSSSSRSRRDDGKSHVISPQGIDDSTTSPPSPLRSHSSSGDLYDTDDSISFSSQKIPYVDDVINYMLQKEKIERITYVPLNLPKEQQKNFFKMRKILFDWLIEVQESFGLSSETLHITFYMADFFISKNLQKISSDKLQLIGVASMLIASKYQDVSPPELTDFIYVTDNTYSKRMLLQMELEILGSLCFSVGSVSSFFFFQKFASLGELDIVGHCLGKLFLEVSFFSPKFFNWDKSLVATSAVYLAGKILKNKCIWTESLMKTIHRKEIDVVECASNILETFKELRESESPCALIIKYSDTKYYEVAQIINDKLKEEDNIF